MSREKLQGEPGPFSNVDSAIVYSLETWRHRIIAEGNNGCLPVSGLIKLWINRATQRVGKGQYNPAISVIYGQYKTHLDQRNLGISGQYLERKTLYWGILLKIALQQDCLQTRKAGDYDRIVPQIEADLNIDFHDIRSTIPSLLRELEEISEAVDVFS